MAEIGILVFAKRGKVSSGILRSNIVLVAALGATSAQAGLDPLRRKLFGIEY